MATRIGPADTVRVAINGTENQVSIVNVFWCKLTKSGTVAQADLDTWLTAFANAFKTRFASVLPDTYSMANEQATYFVDGTALATMKSAATVTGPGTATSNYDNSDCQVISWLSGAYWRGGKPRTYLPAGGGALTVGAPNKINSTARSTLATAAGNFLNDVNALSGGTTITDTALGVVSFRSGNVERVPPLFIPFTGAVVHQRLGTQRRRLGRWAA